MDDRLKTIEPDSELDLAHKAREQATESALEKLEQTGLHYPQDFDQRVGTMMGLNEGYFETICSQTAAYLLGLTDSPVIIKQYGVWQLDTDIILQRIREGFRLAEFTNAQLADILADPAEHREDLDTLRGAKLAVLSTVDPQYINSHWMVLDPEPDEPLGVYQTDNYRRPFRKTDIGEVMRTGNFYMLNALKELKGDYKIEFFG